MKRMLRKWLGIDDLPQITKIAAEWMETESKIDRELNTKVGEADERARTALARTGEMDQRLKMLAIEGYENRFTNIEAALAYLTPGPDKLEAIQTVLQRMGPWKHTETIGRVLGQFERDLSKHNQTVGLERGEIKTLRASWQETHLMVVDIRRDLDKLKNQSKTLFSETTPSPSDPETSQAPQSDSDRISGSGGVSR